MSAHIPAHRQTGRRPLGRLLLAPLVTALVMGVATLWVVLETAGESRGTVAVFGASAAVLLTVTVAVADHGRRARGKLREQVEGKEAEAAHLADELLPALVHSLRDGDSAETALTRVPQAADPAHQRVLARTAREIGAGERMRASAMSACANAAGRVQALATSMLAELREMEERHGEEVLGDLLKLDHSTAQAGRLADSIAVLTGARSGRRWTRPIPMESILRGSVGRISDYQRVRLHSTSTSAVAGYAAEGVMHALAELMDNATSFSPPSEEVHVYVEEVSAGVAVSVEDAGLVMSPAALRRAEEAVSAEPLDLTSLSGTRLGLAVVGCLARKHQLTVSFRPSARGGTGVVVMIPQRLISEVRTRPEPDAPRSTEPARTAPHNGSTARPALTRRTGPSRRTAGAERENPRPVRGSGGAVPSEPLHSVPGNGPTAGGPTADNPTANGPTGDRPAGDRSTGDRATGDGPATGGGEVHGLPRRRRGQTLATAARSAEAARRAESAPARPRADAGARFGAFRSASRGSVTGAPGPSGSATAPRPAGSPAAAPDQGTPNTPAPEHTGPGTPDASSPTASSPTIAAPTTATPHPAPQPSAPHSPHSPDAPEAPAPPPSADPATADPATADSATADPATTDQATGTPGRSSSPGATASAGATAPDESAEHDTP